MAGTAWSKVWENSPKRLIPQTWVLTARILRRWSRDPATLVQSLVMPAGFLVALDIVLGDGIEKVTGHSGLYGQVPLVALVGGHDRCHHRRGRRHAGTRGRSAVPVLGGARCTAVRACWPG